MVIARQDPEDGTPDRLQRIDSRTEKKGGGRNWVINFRVKRAARD